MHRLRAAALAASLLTALVAGAARADDDDQVCGDRPGNAHANCTVPNGRWQLETDLYDQSWQKTGDVEQTVTFYTNPTLKYGLSDTVDLEIGMAPWITTRTKDRATGRVTWQRGPGDLSLQAKVALTKEITVMPFVTAPTALDGQGAGGWGGGVRLPMQFNLPAKGWTIGFTPELDATHDAQGGGAHLTHAEVVGLNKDVGRGVNLGVELYGQWDYDPAGESRAASFDLTAAWVPAGMKDLQLDAQVNFGLTRDTPDAQLIVGLTKRW